MPEPPVPAVPDQKKDEKHDERVSAIIKDLEQAFFTIKFYPVAAKDEAKNQAIQKIRSVYSKEDDTIRQLVLYMIHEAISQAAEMRNMHNFEHFKRKMPAADPAQLRINVYRAMFNYNFSIEGLMEFISLLSTLGGDDATKLLTYHFTFFSSIEGESVHMLKNAVIDALGESNSPYALNCLLTYAKFTDNDALLGRIAAALAKWGDKIEDLKLVKKEKDRLREELHHILMLESGTSHYG